MLPEAMETSTGPEDTELQLFQRHGVGFGRAHVRRLPWRRHGGRHGAEHVADGGFSQTIYGCICEMHCIILCHRFSLLFLNKSEIHDQLHDFGTMCSKFEIGFHTLDFSL